MSRCVLQYVSPKIDNSTIVAREKRFNWIEKNEIKTAAIKSKKEQLLSQPQIHSRTIEIKAKHKPTTANTLM